jgi:methionyl aminopeptidase
MIVRKTAAEIETMARAGRVVASTLELMESSAREGVTTGELDALAEEYIRSCGGVPTFKGYRGFPGSICASPNEMIVHGIPGPYRLEQGDLLSLDVGVTLDGFVADSAITIPIGTVSEQAYALIDVCQKSLDAAIAQCRAGNRLGDISHAVQEVVEANGFGVVRALVGHGVGRSMHEDPQIPNYGVRDKGPTVRAGFTGAIEPMVTLGGSATRVLGDDWTVITLDGSRAAHWEHSVAVTEAGLTVLTAVDGGAARLGDAYVPLDG